MKEKERNYYFSISFAEENSNLFKNEINIEEIDNYSSIIKCKSVSVESAIQEIHKVLEYVENDGNCAEDFDVTLIQLGKPLKKVLFGDPWTNKPGTTATPKEFIRYEIYLFLETQINNKVSVLNLSGLYRIDYFQIIE